jgi:hypothetical protein
MPCRAWENERLACGRLPVPCSPEAFSQSFQDRAIKLKWECLVEEARRHQGEEFLHTTQKAHKVKEPEASKAGHAYWAYAMPVADGDHLHGLTI